jgi:hypothetical protein
VAIQLRMGNDDRPWRFMSCHSLKRNLEYNEDKVNKHLIQDAEKEIMEGTPAGK